MRLSLAIPSLVTLASLLAFFSFRNTAAGSDDKPAAGASNKPNIILILSDDCGYADFGFQDVVAEDMKGRTPALDALAKSGTVFTQAHSSGLVCSPTRAGILTGRYQQSFGHENNLPPGSKLGLPLTETTLPQLMAKQGYTTEAFGKWHLGYAAAYHPNERGFAHYFGFLQGSRSYYPYPDDKVSPHHVFLNDKKPTPETGYVTDRIGDAVVASIATHAKDGKPFFQYVAFSAAHGPLQPRKEDADWVKALPAKGGRANYIGLMKALDENVAKITAAVKDAGIADRTLIILTNDNGGQTQVGANNGILRGHKGEIWEGGSRIPMAIVWPGHVPAGKRLNDTVTTLDLLPTFLEAAGAPLPTNLHGISLLPLATGQVDHLPEMPRFWRMGGPSSSSAVKIWHLKLVQEREKGQTTPRLFDLAQDPSEKNDLASARPADVTRLGDLLAAWEAKLPVPLWGPGSTNSSDNNADEN